MSYEIVFTRGFKDGLEGLPRELLPIVNRHLSSIAEDPYARDTNRLRMKNAPRTFRAKIGSHVRMLYRVLDHLKQVTFLGIGPRAGIYDRESGRVNTLDPVERDALLAQLKGSVPPAPKSPPTQHLGAPASVDLPVEIEGLDWICEDELFLLQIPHEAWPAILKARSIQDLRLAPVDSGIKERIEDYLTSPEQTQVEKLYSLSPGQGIETVAQQPLSKLLITLDPEQRVALQRIKNQGPYLLKGSAGTGKSLVGLYHIRDSILSRVGESLFDIGTARFGVITYTNTLVDANRTLLCSITPDEAHPDINVTTLDKVAEDLAGKALGMRPNRLAIEGIAKFLKEKVAPQFEPGKAEAQLLDRLGHDYVAEEIEQAIIGNGLEKLSEYLQLERRGRKRSLRGEEREFVWKLYLALMDTCAELKVQTFERIRLLARDYLRTHPEYPRYAVLFVDEAQDFSKVARQLCLELIADPRYLLLAADTGQSIYTVPASWRQCDARFNFQSRRSILLSRSYRATSQIGQAIAPLRSDPGDEEDRSTDAAPVFSGPKPCWIDARMEDHPGIVTEQIEKLVRDNASPISAGQIAIIVRKRDRAERYMKLLKSHKINCAIVKKGGRLRVDHEQVHVITAHSSKGLGFPVVFVPEVSAAYYPLSSLLRRASDPQHLDEIEANEQRLLYVALSRASNRLYMVADSESPSPFLGKLDRSAHWTAA